MQLTTFLRHRLNRLKNMFVQLDDGSVLLVSGFEEDEIDYKPFLCKSRKVQVLTKILLAGRNEKGDGYVPYFIEDDFRQVIRSLEIGRKRFITMRKDLELFGYTLRGISR